VQELELLHCYRDNTWVSGLFNDAVRTALSIVRGRKDGEFCPVTLLLWYGILYAVFLYGKNLLSLRVVTSNKRCKSWAFCRKDEVILLTCAVMQRSDMFGVPVFNWKD